GTFGLVSFSAELKSKEIGIRKVLGASVGHVTKLLLNEFVMLLLLASLISWPITWYFMNGWMENFVYHTHIGFGMFVIASVFALVIVVGTTGFRAVKAALVNPVESLRDE
ncbi:MAG: FtsX-like permease family protein, partial [Bacteroidetes bacterium]|nr:FtsX-like permease family protein [Bacteroidota bacterium]